MAALLSTASRAELLGRNDRWDNTALHAASCGGHLDIVTQLVKAGAQVTRNKFKYNILLITFKYFSGGQ